MCANLLIILTDLRKKLLLLAPTARKSMESLPQLWWEQQQVLQVEALKPHFKTCRSSASAWHLCCLSRNTPSASAHHQH